jgi:type IV pilus assembly protein PilC
MSNFPDIFDKVFVNLVNAGEASGRLSDVFQHLTESLKWHDEIIAKTKKALLYPAFMAVVIIGALFFLMIYLVPELVQFVTEVGGAELPLHTRVLIYVSDTFKNHWNIILFAPILIFFSLKIAMKTSLRLRFLVDRLKLRIWLVGPIVEKVILARFANYFALLYRSGIPVIQGLEISSVTAGNLVIEDALHRVRDSIVDGGGIAQSFERVNLFPPLVLRMVRIGETTGELDASLLNISYFYDREAKEKIDRLQSLIEPSLTVFLGALLGWIIISVMGPIYDVIVDVSGGLNQQQQLHQQLKSKNPSKQRGGFRKFTND